MSRPSPDVELTLHINGVPQARVNASSVYLQNASKATADAFAKYVIGHRDEVHFVATPLVPSRDPTFVDFRLKIQTEQLV